MEKTWRSRFETWPGRGPFSHLPPWQRPGWYFGRGLCWRYFYPYWRNAPTIITRSETDALEAYKAELEKELKDVEARIKELRESVGKQQ